MRRRPAFMDSIPRVRGKEGNMGKAKDPMNVLYGLGALALGAMVALKAGSWLKPPVDLGFFSKVLIFLVAVPLGYLGAKIGDLIRKLTIPDAIFTTEGMWGIIKAKIFWFIVPQFIGLIIGSAAGGWLVAYPLSAGERAKVTAQREAQMKERFRQEDAQRRQQMEHYAEENRKAREMEDLRHEYEKDKIGTVLFLSQVGLAMGKENPEYPHLLQKLQEKYGALEFPNGRTLESDFVLAQKNAATRPTTMGMSDRLNACLVYRKYGLTGNALLLDERDAAELDRRLRNKAKMSPPAAQGAGAASEAGQGPGHSQQEMLEAEISNTSDMGYQLGYLASCSDIPSEASERFYEWARAQYGGRQIAAFSDAFENGEEAHASTNGRDCDRVRRKLQKLVPQLLQ